jgi:glycerol-3-phosphate acyltransferase PlsY
MTVAAIVVAGYLLGSCPWGYWLVRVFRGEDVRAKGSGNIGISNVWRNYGWHLGIPVVLLDFGKGFAPALAGLHEVSALAGVLAGGAAMVGHWRPLYLRFQKSGKMVATAGGVFFAIAPLLAVSGLGVWLSFFFVSGYASIGSLATALFMPPGAWLYGYPKPTIGFSCAAGLAVLALHYGNIRRLFGGTESRSKYGLLGRRSRSSRGTAVENPT